MKILKLENYKLRMFAHRTHHVIKLLPLRFMQAKYSESRCRELDSTCAQFHFSRLRLLWYQGPVHSQLNDPDQSSLGGAPTLYEGNISSAKLPLEHRKKLIVICFLFFVFSFPMSVRGGGRRYVLWGVVPLPSTSAILLSQLKTHTSINRQSKTTINRKLQ